MRVNGTYTINEPHCEKFAEWYFAVEKRTRSGHGFITFARYIGPFKTGDDATEAREALIEALEGGR